jgi:hypothetical protein
VNVADNDDGRGGDDEDAPSGPQSQAQGTSPKAKAGAANNGKVTWNELLSVSPSRRQSIQCVRGVVGVGERGGPAQAGSGSPKRAGKPNKKRSAAVRKKWARAIAMVRHRNDRVNDGHLHTDPQTHKQRHAREVVSRPVTHVPPSLSPVTLVPPIYQTIKGNLYGRVEALHSGKWEEEQEQAAIRDARARGIAVVKKRGQSQT